MSKSLKKLPVNKTVVFWSPIEGEDVLVRTGSVDDSSSFFHAVLYAYSKEYAGMSKNNRIEYVKKLRASLVGNISIEKWRDSEDILTVKKPVVENFLVITEKLYEYASTLENNNKNNNKNISKNIKRILDKMSNSDFLTVIPDLVPLDRIKKILTSTGHDETNSQGLKSLRKHALGSITGHLQKLPEIATVTKEKADYIRKNVIEVFDLVFDTAEAVVYKNYVKGLSTVGVKINPDLINTLSRRIDRNIYVLDANSRMPRLDLQVPGNIDKTRFGIIILSFDDGICETVGRLLTDNKVQREHDVNEPLIRLLNTLILSPKRFPDKYPELVKYLPEEVENSSRSVSEDSSEDSSSRSSSSEESSSYSDSDTSNSD